MALWIKICGVRRVEDAQAAFEAGADAIGINFWDQSKRYCEPERAKQLVAELSKSAKGALVFGVFCDATRAEMEKTVRDVGLTGVQLHGSEPKSAELGWKIPVLRAVPATSQGAVSAMLRYREARLTGMSPDARTQFRLLVDNAAGGGSGVAIEAGLLGGLDLGESIVAGGLTPQNVADTVARLRPFGVDTAGGVESAPGVKDASRIADFIAAARGARNPE